LRSKTAAGSPLTSSPSTGRLQETNSRQPWAASRRVAQAGLGQILFEWAERWTDPPRVTADVSGLSAQTVIPLWARVDDATAGQGPADDRPVQVVAVDIAHATPLLDEGDGTAPPHPD
jgi:hypothetical protein